MKIIDMHETVASNARVKTWRAGRAPVAVVMLSLNEAHNMEAVLNNIDGWAQEVFLVDSYSMDGTVDIALRRGVHVVQREFRGFGDQWNFALRELPIRSPWTMKLDPDERLTERLKADVIQEIEQGIAAGISFDRRLWFMGKPMPIKQRVVRIWKSGACRFTDVTVNEHPVVQGRVEWVKGNLEHHDSPDLHHWFAKQNSYTTAEAVAQFENRRLAAEPTLFGNSLERRMWIKHNFWKIPGRFTLLFAYNLLVAGGWKAGRVGWIWARLRSDIYRIWFYKRLEMELTGKVPVALPRATQLPHPGVEQYD